MRVLGFCVVCTYGEPPFYAQTCRDAARVILKAMDVPVFAGDIRERESLLSADIGLASAAGGARKFIVRDPDGNLLLFAAPADTGS